MSRQRFTCKCCGKGFLSKPWEPNGTHMVCHKMRCMKAVGIYVRPRKLKAV